MGIKPSQWDLVVDWFLKKYIPPFGGWIIIDYPEEIKKKMKDFDYKV